MQGTEKQIQYATSLRDRATKNLSEMIVDVDYYKNKTREGKTPEQLARRDKMIADYESANAERQNIIDTLNNYTGHAGTMIDVCQGQYWEMSKNSRGYKMFSEMNG